MSKLGRAKNGKLVALLAIISLLVIALVTALYWRKKSAVSEINDTPPYSIRIDVGSDHESRDHSGRLYLADQEWTAETQVGYIGGYRVWNPGKAHPTDGTPDEFLHTNQRHNWEEYRFSDIPNGDYLVDLVFSEIGVPHVTVFDVAIEGQTVLDDFRILDRVGGNYALTRRFVANVDDGELNVTARSVVGDPRLAAIEVASRPPDLVPPAIPANLVTTNSYGAVLLNWADNHEDDLAGYFIYSATLPAGPYSRLTAEPIRISHFQDHVANPHVTNYYCVSAIDVYENESDRSPCQAGFALDTEEAILPLYELEVSAEDLVDLYSHALSDEEVNGTFTYENQAYPVTVRYRGGYGRYIHKKSWKVNFADGAPFPGRDQLNLRADYIDPTLMHTKLATELFEAAGVQLPEAEYVLLTLNGEYLGVYISNEQVDEGFLARTNHHPDVSIYKAVHTDTHDFTKAQPSEQAYYEAYEKKTNRNEDYGDIIDFIELINRSPDETFATELTRVFDVAGFLEFYAISILISNGDFVHHNAYLLYDSDADKWEIVPYDFDVIFQMVDRPINEGTAASPIQPRGWNGVLITRVLDVPQFRAYYCRRLAEFLDTVFSDAALSTLVDETFSTIEHDGYRDWNKWHRENNDWFAAGPDTIKTYAAARRAFLRNEIAAYCPVPQPFLNINEVMVDNETTLEDPAEPSAFPAWFEIHNPGLESVDLSGIYLTDDLADTTQFKIPAGVTLPAGGFITFLADGDTSKSPLHTSFVLDGRKGQLGIFSGTHQIDAYTFGLQQADVSEGRYPDGTGNWMFLTKPTPGQPNLLLSPIISSTTHFPSQPTATGSVTITSIITDDDAALTATLHYSANGTSFVGSRMHGVPGDPYHAQIPSQPSGTLVQYYVLARDSDGQTSVDPAGAPIILYEYMVDYHPPALFINEFLANATRAADSSDVLTDWVELHNAGPLALDLGGMYLTDDLNNPTKYQIPSHTTIAAGGYAVLYAEGNPEQGVPYTGFRLNRSGESVGLFGADATGNRLIDAYTFGAQATGVSEGRCPDGNARWVFLSPPTPGAINFPCGIEPDISNVGHQPTLPSANDSVIITATIADTGSTVTATLWYSTAGGFEATTMLPQGVGAYVATLQAQSSGTAVAYYVEIENTLGHTVTDPPDAPVSVYRYAVGYQPPPLFINEFMAVNDTTLLDPDEPGEFPDWIELYNAGSTPIDLGGRYLTDDLADPTRFRIPNGVTVPGGGFIVFYADNDPEQGSLHITFRLSRTGESIALFDVDATGNQLIDTYTFASQTPDTSERRYPDGGEIWRTESAPTPGTANGSPPPP